MNRHDAWSVGDVFNARDLDNREIATSFVSPPVFKRLLSPSHCVLEGPRGSGKTTLLRMLTPEAYALWANHRDTDNIDFIGIFVPADIRWAKQLELKISGIPNIDEQNMVQQAAFSIAVSLSLLNTLISCDSLSNRYEESFPEIFFKIDRRLEASIVHALAELWGLTCRVPSFTNLRLELRKCQLGLSALIYDLSQNKQVSETAFGGSFLHHSWLETLITSVETLNDILERPKQRWAVLLDELEIVPERLLRTIIDALRSTSNVVRFKLAMSPTGADLITGSELASSSPSDDYRPIKLWYSSSREARGFSEALFSSALERLNVKKENQTLEQVLGQSYTINNSDSGALEESESRGLHAKRARIAAFRSLYDKDESFRKLLESKQIDPENPPLLDSNSNGTLVRKITPIVIHRDLELDEFSLSKGLAKRRGGRRGTQAYQGYPNLIDLAEGNPRWILTLAEALAAYRSSNSLDIGKATVQTQAINEFVQQFISKLTVYPAKSSIPSLHWTPKQFMEALGQCIAANLYDKPFSTDPSMSFIIDKKALKDFGPYLKVCVDLGALVIINRGTPAPLESEDSASFLDGARVRISYRLAPYFRLPLRSTKTQTISSALKLQISQNANNPRESFSHQQRLL